MSKESSECVFEKMGFSSVSIAVYKENGSIGTSVRDTFKLKDKVLSYKELSNMINYMLSVSEASEKNVSSLSITIYPPFLKK